MADDLRIPDIGDRAVVVECELPVGQRRGGVVGQRQLPLHPGTPVIDRGIADREGQPLLELVEGGERGCIPGLFSGHLPLVTSPQLPRGQPGRGAGQKILQAHGSPPRDTDDDNGRAVRCHRFRHHRADSCRLPRYESIQKAADKKRWTLRTSRAGKRRFGTIRGIHAICRNAVRQAVHPAFIRHSCTSHDRPMPDSWTRTGSRPAAVVISAVPAGLRRHGATGPRRSHHHPGWAVGRRTRRGHA